MAWDRRWSGGSDHRGRPAVVSGASQRRRCRRVLRGVLECDTVAAVSRCHCQADLPSRVVGTLRRRQPPIRRGHLTCRCPGRDGVGAGLPVAVGPEDAARTAARSDHRILSAHSVSPGGALHAVALARGDHRRAARCGPRRIPSGRRGAELPLPRPATGRSRDDPRDGGCPVPVGRSAAGRPHREGGCVPHLHRLRRTGSHRPQPRNPETCKTDSHRAWQPTQVTARRGPAGLYERYRRPAEGILGVTRRRPNQGRRHRTGAAGHPQPRTRRQLPHSA